MLSIEPKIVSINILEEVLCPVVILTAMEKHCTERTVIFYKTTYLYRMVADWKSTSSLSSPLNHC